MIDDHDLVVRTVREGPICTLAVGGGLDMIAADRFLAHVTRALDSRTERLVFDLADLTFLDCSGARALAAAVDAVPAECPVIIRSVSPPAIRLLGLLEMNLEQRQEVSGSGTERAAKPAGPEETMRPEDTLRPEDLFRETLRIVTAVAGTEERLARTLAEMARQRLPEEAARLTVLSENARSFAARNRRWVSREKQVLARAAR